jgi:hypothetical protein
MAINIQERDTNVTFKALRLSTLADAFFSSPFPPGPKGARFPRGY